MIPDHGAFAVFAAASLALAVVPGPAVLYIVAQSVPGGRRAGVVSALGVSTGGLFHVAAAVIGLSALLAASAEAFTAVKLLGAAYLVFLGIRTLLGRDGRIGGRQAETTLGRTYRRGVVVNVLNPKTALFFLAFLPQFVDPARLDAQPARRARADLRADRARERHGLGSCRRDGRRCAPAEPHVPAGAAVRLGDDLPRPRRARRDRRP